MGLCGRLATAHIPWLGWRFSLSRRALSKLLLPTGFLTKSWSTAAFLRSLWCYMLWVNRDRWQEVLLVVRLGLVVLMLLCIGEDGWHRVLVVGSWSLVSWIFKWRRWCTFTVVPTSERGPIQRLFYFLALFQQLWPCQDSGGDLMTSGW